MTTEIGERRQVRLGLIGYGEVGSNLGRGLRREGLAAVSAYDIAAFAGPFSGLIQGRAREAGVELVRSPSDLARAADIIIVAVPGNQCVPAAEAMAPHLDAHHVYIDIGSATPQVKRRVGEALRQGGAAVSDGGIMGSPLNDGHHIAIKLSGPAAEAFRAALTPWGMQLEVVSAELGAGSGIKIVRSIVMKGLEALLHECAVTSTRYGIRDEVFQSISEFMDARPFLDSISFLLRSGVIHAARRAEEAAMSAEAAAEVGVDPVMTRATAAMLEHIAAMGLKEQFGGVVPQDCATAVAAVDEALRRQS